MSPFPPVWWLPVISGPQHPLGRQVDGQVAQPDLRQVAVGVRPPADSAHPGKQLVHRERLGDVIVGAGVQRLDLVGAVGAAGQHDDRRVGPPPQALNDLHAIQVRQAEIQDHQVGGIFRGQLECLGAGPGGVHLVLPHPQVDPQRAEYLRLVVDHQHGRHGTSLSCQLPRPGLMVPPRGQPGAAAGLARRGLARRGLAASARPTSARRTSARPTSARQAARRRPAATASWSGRRRGSRRPRACRPWPRSGRGTAPGRARLRWCCRCRPGAGTARTSGPGGQRVCRGRGR